MGRVRDHRTFTSPILGSRRCPASVSFQRAFAVNRMAWRVSLRDLNDGSPSLGPLRSPLREAKKLLYALSASRRDCCSTTEETSPSQARSGVFLASVIRMRDRAPIFGKGSLFSRAARRARTASL